MENPRIILIDDNPSIHEDYRKILCPVSQNANDRLTNLKAQILKKSSATITPQTFSMDSAFQGQEGLERVIAQREKGESYALAFVDMRMPPGWDGLETIVRLWEVDPKIQIIICSAYSDYDWGQIITRVGISENLVILKKPFDKEEVLQLAHALTKKWGLFRHTQAALETLAQKVVERTQELVIANTQLQENIDRRERMEIELRLAQKLESIGLLAAGIAHEINTPTQYVGDNVRFLQEGYETFHRVINEIEQGLHACTQNTQRDGGVHSLVSRLQDQELIYFLEEIPKALRDTIAGVDRIADIVQAMKAFSHPGIKEVQSTDINVLIENTVKVSTHEWKYVADINLDLSPNLPMIQCYPNELSQVLLNMIVNAVHAIESRGAEEGAKGHIRILTKMGHKDVEVTISDTGTGIPQHIQDKIFDPFFTTKEVGKGTGQGLAISHSVIVKKMKGSLDFTTEEGKGTTFYLKLPVSNDKLPLTTSKEVL